MLRKVSIAVLAAAAVSASAGAFANDSVFPFSVNESGPVIAEHAAAPSQPTGHTTSAAPVRELQGGTEADRTPSFPSSVSESAPWLSGTTR